MMVSFWFLDYSRPNPCKGFDSKREDDYLFFRVFILQGFTSSSNLYLNKIFHLKTVHNYHYPFVKEKVIIFFIIREFKIFIYWVLLSACYLLDTGLDISN